QGRQTRRTANSAPTRARQTYADNQTEQANYGESLLQQFFDATKAPVAKYPECQYFGKRGRFDLSLFIIVLVLAVFGLVMMGSASYAYSLYENRDSFDFMKQQMEGMIIGLVLMVFISAVDYNVLIMPIRHIIRHFFGYIGMLFGGKDKKKPKTPKNGKGLNICYLFFFTSIVLMAVTCVAGEEVADARRWLTIMGLRFQPSEIMKFAMIILIAFMVQRLYDVRQKVIAGFGRYLLVFGLCGVLCVLQRHISAVIIVFTIVMIMMYAGEVSRKGMAFLMLTIGMLFIGVLAFSSSYITVRVDGWLDPFGDMQNTTYQTSQSLITIGSGGLFGRGLGNSIQKYYYLPEAQNDFVFSVLCEELGFVGGITVILLFVLFAVRGYKISKGAKDTFGAFLALGITVHIVLQAFLNIGVACNAIPNTGISLPFFSFGRTALITQLVEAGVLLSVSRSSET
ncbi:MAG: cell division protein FtsW, partial [Ruminiclostridium sp.]|nr:cell division protein FtsW [Ruminiclostridium sp.]